MSMIVFESNGIFLWWCDLDATIIDRGATWDLDSKQAKCTGINKATVSYGYYKYKEIVREYDEEGEEVPIYMADLALEAMTWEGLPQSMHVAALKSVAMVAGSPRATVYRMYQGTVFEIPGCRAAQQAYDSYLAGTLKVYDPVFDWQAPENKDCFTLVYFVSETPYSDEIQIPVVIDKVNK